jgi:hypothetical protein
MKSATNSSTKEAALSWKNLRNWGRLIGGMVGGFIHGRAEDKKRREELDSRPRYCMDPTCPKYRQPMTMEEAKQHIMDAHTTGQTFID